MVCFLFDKGFCRNDNVLCVYTIREDIVKGYRVFSILLLRPGVSVCKFTMSRLGKVSDKRDEVIRRSIEERRSSVQRLKKNIKIL